MREEGGRGGGRREEGEGEEGKGRGGEGERQSPDCRTLMTEELNELGNEDVERSVQSVRVQLVIAVLTDLVQCTEGTLAGGRRQRGTDYHNCYYRRRWTPDKTKV